MLTVVSRFRQVVEEHAARRAVRGDSITWTYRELDAAADRIARALVAQGVGRGDYVPMSMGRSPWFIAGCVGVLKAGAAYVPIDPNYPAERRQAILADLLAAMPARGTEPRRLVGLRLSSPGTSPDAPASGPAASWITIDALESTPRVAADRAASLPWEHATPEDPAYVMFTSGSTGVPKGAVIPHRGITRLVCETDYAHFGPEQVWAHLASVSFDATTLEIWGPLLNGGCCAVFEDAAPSIDQLADRFASMEVTDAFVTAALFNSIVEYRPEAITRLRQVYTGGEMESVRHFRRVLEAAPGIRLVHAYGPTEVTTFALCHDVRAEDLAGDSPRIPIGRPIRGTTMRICLPDGSESPGGEPGELLLGGPGVALGYLNRPEATREKFITRDGEPGLWYRTGDVVRTRADGAVVFVGRVDRQVKVRGFRIEPEEIEKRLLECPGLAGAVVEVEGDTPESRRLVAYCAPVSSSPGAGGAAAQAPPAAIHPERVREFLAARLPGYMIPAGIIVVPDQQIGLTGKTDRRALVAAGRRLGTQNVGPQRISEGADASPLSAVESELARIWESLIPGSNPGKGTDFFEAGGHSITVMKLIAEVRQRWGVALKPSAIYSNRTLAAIARLVDAAPESARAASGAPDDSTPPPERSPCGPAQRSLYYEWRLRPTSSHYHVILPFICEPGFDPERFAQAWHGAAARHPSLRATMHETAQGLEQRFGPASSVAELCPVIRAQDLDWSGEGSIPDVAAAAWQAPFDLNTGPVARVHLSRLAGGRWLVALVFHHAVIDEWSVGLLLDDLAGAAQPAVTHPAHFVAWAASHTRRDEALAMGERLAREAQAEYRIHLRGRQVARETRLTVPPAITQRVEVLAREERASPFPVFLAAYGLAIARRFGLATPRILTPFSNRAEPSLRSVVGCVIDVRMLACPVGEEGTFRSLVGAMNTICLAEQDQGPLPLEDVARGLHAAGCADSDLALQFALTFRVDVDRQRSLGGAPARPLPIAPTTTKFGVLLDVLREGDRIDLRIEGSAHDSVAQDLLGEVLQVLDRGLTNPDAPLATGPLSASPAPARLTLRPAAAAPAPRPGDAEPAPGTELVAGCCQDLWARVLGRPADGDAQDFFASGGTSLSAMRLAAEVRRTIGTELDLGEFVRAPTLGNLKHLAGRPSRATNPWVVLGEDDAPTLLLAIPGVLGKSISYYHFWRTIDSVLPGAVQVLSVDFDDLTRPLHALPGQRPSATVRDVVDRIVPIVRSRLGRRTLAIAGYSLGGVLAIECAAALSQRGVQPAHLWLLDTFPPSRLWPSATQSAGDLFRMATTNPWATLVKAARRLGQIPRRAARTAQPQPAPPGSSEMVRVVGEADLLRHALLAQPPARFTGPATVVRSHQVPRRRGMEFVGPFNGMEPQLLGPRASVTIDVDHLEFLRTGVDRVAQAMMPALEPIIRAARAAHATRPPPGPHTQTL